MGRTTPGWRQNAKAMRMKWPWHVLGTSKMFIVAGTEPKRRKMLWIKIKESTGVPPAGCWKSNGTSDFALNPVGHHWTVLSKELWHNSSVNFHMFFYLHKNKPRSHQNVIFFSVMCLWNLCNYRCWVFFFEAKIYDSNFMFFLTFQLQGQWIMKPPFLLTLLVCYVVSTKLKMVSKRNSGKLLATFSLFSQKSVVLRASIEYLCL